MGRVLPTLAKQNAPLASGAEQRATLATVPLTRSFEASLAQSRLYPLRATDVDILQINVGKKCNQTCRHCHVDAGPDRTEVMPRDVLEKCLEVLSTTDIPTIDITGGAPELHPDFRELVQRASAMGKHVMDRCNLTVLLLPNYATLPDFFANHNVEIMCSLPHYRAKLTNAQRGDGVFDESLEALRRLNEVGYGKPDSGLRLNLVTNPVGAFLPGNQESLEREWKRELERRYDIVFNELYTITNMPISRFLEWLEESENLETYMTKLVNSFNPGAARGVMCRNTLSVGWDGQIYDCDFNQMLELEMTKDAPQTIFDFDVERLRRREIAVGPHCFGCTAGAGSSCGGVTA